MKSCNIGANISNPEILNISKDGIWLYVEKKEYFLSYGGFPWFKNAKISDIYDVRMAHAKHLYWPHLDVDLDLDCLENPEKYPLRHSKINN